MNPVKARFYKHEKDIIRCALCPHRCRIREGERGLCGVRRVCGNELYTLNYGACAAVAMDPVEKKPLYHFYPGREILSIGSFGCNFQCSFCQNWSLARGEVQEGCAIQPGDVLNLLNKDSRMPVGVAYTYNEPLVWFEFVCDTAKLVHESGYANVLVTNGFMASEAFEAAEPYLSALNIDIKSFQEGFYRRYCRGSLHEVLDTVKRCAGRLHLEITYLIIPTLNDSLGELGSLVDWLADIDADIPLHFSRYYPRYKLSLPPTPVETLERARELALKKLRYVYLGNVGGHRAGSTFCARCGSLLIKREGYRILNTGLDQKKCSDCGRELPFVGDGVFITDAR